ncbi:MAG: sn-glycerol-3-phosphate ABC transporter ATP-binding protein UgpC [Spirochaetes bacterium]|nr:sn-glycerol-3-phosphate ABC transporter ATP-binding protein UgpC [Spirochaetota bacterium]
MSKVILKNVCKIYEGGVKAVDNFNLEIEDKEFVVLVGPSGCGKSTTLRMVAGLEEISSGELYIGEKLVNDVPPKSRDIAMVFQNYALYPHMTVYKNMEFGLKLRKYPQEEIDRRVREAASILGIEELLDRQPKALSGGQRQRVALGRAIVRKPKVFLFDEPLSNLDAKLRVQMRAEISKLHVRLQATMIYVTHDQVEAMTMADRIVVMRDGLVQQIGNPLVIYGNPRNKFVAGFIGSPPMNFCDIDVLSEGGKLYITDGAFKVKVPAEKAAIVKAYMDKTGKKSFYYGIRAEDILDQKSYAGTVDENTLKANVEVVEPMGADTHIYADSGKTPLIFKLDLEAGLMKVGDNVPLVMNVGKGHFFDRDTEANIAELL